MVTIYFLSRKQPTNCRLRIVGFNSTYEQSCYEGFGVDYGKTLFVWICAVIFLLVLKDFIFYSKEEQFMKGY